MRDWKRERRTKSGRGQKWNWSLAQFRWRTGFWRTRGSCSSCRRQHNWSWRLWLVAPTGLNKVNHFFILSGLKEKVFEKKMSSMIFFGPVLFRFMFERKFTTRSESLKKSFSFEWSISKNGEAITFSIWKWGVGGFLNIKCSVDVSESIFYAKAFMQRFAKRSQARLSQSRIKNFVKVEPKSN